MKFWLDFFKDKRFSWDFKIANFIMRDSLRNYLAIDVAILKEIKHKDNKKIDKVIKDLNTLMRK